MILGLMKFSLYLATFSAPEMVKLGVEADKQNFYSLLISDHIVEPSELMGVDPWAVLTTVGVLTKRIRLSTHVTDVQRIHPAKIAHMTATIDELTEGRFCLGLGAGEAMNLVPFGIPFETPDERVQRLREGIEVIRLLWNSSSGARVNYKGKFYRLDNAWMIQRSVQKPCPPIYIGALGASKTFKLVGEMGDGWYTAYNTVDIFKDRVRIIKEAAERAGRSLDAIDRVATMMCVMSEDRAIQKKALDMYKGLILTLAPKKVKEMGFDAELPAGFDYNYQRVLPDAEALRILTEEAKQMPDEFVEKFLVMGSPNDFIEAVDGYRKAGATHVFFWDMIGENIQHSPEIELKNVRTFSGKVMSHFKSVSP